MPLISRALSSTLQCVPKEDLIDLAPNDGGKVQSVPRLFVKCNGGNLAALMRLADTREDDKAIHIPYDAQLVADLACYVKNGSLNDALGVADQYGCLVRKPHFMTNELRSKHLKRWKALLLASSLYQITDLTKILNEPGLLGIMIRNATTFEARVDLVTFSIAHRSLVPNLTSAVVESKLVHELFSPTIKLDNVAYRVHIDPKALMQYSIKLSQGCQCTDCQATRAQGAAPLDQSSKSSAFEARKRPRTARTRP